LTSCNLDTFRNVEIPEFCSAGARCGIVACTKIVYGCIFRSTSEFCVSARRGSGGGGDGGECHRGSRSFPESVCVGMARSRKECLSIQDSSSRVSRGGGSFHFFFPIFFWWRCLHLKILSQSLLRSAQDRAALTCLFLFVAEKVQKEEE
jgi:hypothetical protein